MKISDLGKGGGQEAPAPTIEPDMIIDGCFGCQICEKMVDEAEYFVQDRILRWKCENDHTSSITEFSL